MTLENARPHNQYKILEISETEDTPLAVRLRQLGFIPGVSLSCEAVAPLFKTPLLVNIRGISVALANNEARLVIVEQVGSHS